MGDLKVAKYLSHSLILNRICDCHQHKDQINAANAISTKTIFFIIIPSIIIFTLIITIQPWQNDEDDINHRKIFVNYHTRVNNNKIYKLLSDCSIV